MLKHRLSKFGSAALVALSMLITGSFTQSCTDDYPYDDPGNTPEWLGESIYDFLAGEHADGTTYNNYLAIIDSLGEKEMLSKTGSKTLFVADDAAFERFYQNNRWGVKSVNDLSKAQMKVLLYSAMLNNAYLIDMMSSLPGNPPTESSCLRRTTSLQAVDTIGYYTSDMLPKHRKFNKYWERFRAENGGTGLRLATDATDPMMVHFLRDYMKAKAVTSLDMSIFFNNKGLEGQDVSDKAYIYQNEVISSGISTDGFSEDTLTVTCKNGYVYRMENVLLPPSNMAEELRQHSRTQIFSHLLDRFSAPVYNDAVSETYNYVNGKSGDEGDSVFVKRYLNKSQAHAMYDVTNGNTTIVTTGDATSVLAFDPGWNQYAATTGANAAEGDMAAMLVPNDEMMYNYFASGEGMFLLEQYAPELFAQLPNEGTDYAKICEALDSVPTKIIASFINNLMLPSFITTIPSKFGQIYNDGSEIMGIEPGHVDECVVANNGVIYILNQVFGPAEYRSVSAPPLTMTNMSIMKAAIDNLGYNSYLLAMDAKYSFIVPDNDYFVYYDPITLNWDEPIAYKFYYDNKYRPNQKDAKLWAKRYKFDPATYELLDTIANYAEEGRSANTEMNGSNTSISYGWGAPSGTGAANFLYNRMTDLLEYLIIVGRVNDGNQYYMSKGYGTIKCDVTFDGSEELEADGSGLPVPKPAKVKFYGGEQLENGTAIAVAEVYPQANGITYCTTSEDRDPMKSGIPTPPTQSVNYKLNPNVNANAHSDFVSFYDLCDGTSVDADGTEISFDSLFSIIYPTLTAKEVADSVKRYSIFYGSTSSSVGSNVPRDLAVPFFSTYHYTVYVPTNDAMQEIYDLGLPTWNQLYEELKSAGEDEDKSGKIAANIRLINKFARYHFQDNAVYVDTKPFSITSAGKVESTARFETAAIDEESGRFFETEVRSEPSKVNSNLQTLCIKDDMNRESYVVNTPGEEGLTWNIMTRDMLLYCRNGNKGINSSKYALSLETSSYAVLHKIDRILLNGGVIGYDGKVRRYADNGELIDTMTVVGVPASAGSVDGKYLVALRTNIIRQDASGNESYHRVAYLAKKNAGGNLLNQETYVLDGNDQKILIDDDGYRLVEVEKKVGKNTTYKYFYADAEGNYFVDADEDGEYDEGEEYTEPQARYNNDGTVIK